MTAWTPANELEATLHDALEAGDEEAFLRALGTALLWLPVQVEARQLSPSWPVVVEDDICCVPVFTSAASVVIGAGDRVRDCLPTGLRELVASWPHPECALLLNPLTPLHSRIASSDLFRLAAVTAAAEGTLLQLFFSTRDATRALAENESVVSGLAVPVDEIEHLSGPQALFDGLPLTRLADIEPGAPTVCAMRWPVVGASRYEPRGLVRSQPPVQAYELHAFRLPHGAVLLRITEDEPEFPVARYDADIRRWVFTPEAEARMDS